jgi:hypothetical protein
MSAIALAWTRRKRRKRRKPGPYEIIILLVFAWFAVKNGLRDLLDGEWGWVVSDWLIAWFCWGRTPIANYYVFHRGEPRDEHRGSFRILKDWIIGVDE